MPVGMFVYKWGDVEMWESREDARYEEIVQDRLEDHEDRSLIEQGYWIVNYYLVPIC